MIVCLVLKFVSYFVFLNNISKYYLNIRTSICMNLEFVEDEPIDEKTKDIKENEMKFISIDIGEKNFTIYIESFDKEKLHKVGKIPKKNRYKSDWTPTPQFNKELKKIYKNGKRIFIDKVNIQGKSDNESFHNLTVYLNSKKKFFDDCDGILIEEQLKRAPFNVKLEQHVKSYFIFNYGLKKVIISFPSKYKTKLLGMEKYQKGMKAAQKKKMRKDWACEKAKEIYNLREDFEGNYMMSKDKKKDDYSDTIIQLQAFKLKCFVDKEMW